MVARRPSSKQSKLKWRAGERRGQQRHNVTRKELSCGVCPRLQDATAPRARASRARHPRRSRPGISRDTRRGADARSATVPAASRGPACVHNGGARCDSKSLIRPQRKSQKQRGRRKRATTCPAPSCRWTRPRGGPAGRCATSGGSTSSTRPGRRSPP